MSEVRRRERAEEKRQRAAEEAKLREKKPTPSYAFWPYHREDEKINPDRVLVLSPADKTKVSTNAAFQSSVVSALKHLNAAGFYVSVRKGLAGSVLLLLRATPVLLSQSTAQGGSTDRAVVVQNAIPYAQLRECGLTDDFAANNGYRRSIFSKYPGYFGLVLKSEAINEIERSYGSFTAGVFELSSYIVIALLFVALSAFISRYMIISSGCSVVAFWWVNQRRYPVIRQPAVVPDIPAAAPENATNAANADVPAVTPESPAGSEAAGAAAALAEALAASSQASPGNPMNIRTGASHGTTSSKNTQQEVSTPKKFTSKSTLAYRRFMFLFVAIAILSLFTLGLFLIFVLEIFCTQVYHGKFAKIVSLVPIAGNIAASIVYGMVYGKVVTRYVEWEGYTDAFDKEETIAQRTFYLDALLAFVPIIFTAFFYIPFGELAARYALVQLRAFAVPRYVPITPSFKLNTGRLSGQASFFMAKQHAVALVMTTVIPWATLFFKRHIFHMSEDAWNSRFAVEQLKAPAFSPNKFASGLVIAFGYSLFLTVVWPMGAVISFFGVWLRVRSTLYVLNSVSKVRPTAAALSRSRNIGFWNTNLKAVLFLAAIVTPALSVVYENLGHSATFLSAPLWLNAAFSSLINENIVIIMFHVIVENVWLVVDKSSAKPATVDVASTQSAEDELFANANIEEELETVFDKKITL